MKNQHFATAVALAAGLVATALPAAAQEQVLNLYSARHYSTDEALYADFTKATGIKINRVDADDAGILARLKAEGAASPADVILLVDAARLYKGEAEGLFKPVKSKVLEDAIPAQYRGTATAEGTPWFGFSTRARVIVYDKIKVKREDVDTYEELGDPKNKGRICIRSGSHPYNLSLFGAVTEHLGEAKAQEWLKGVQANLARDPKGGDSDQIKAVAAGECQIAVSNTYYIARLMRSSNPEDRAAMEKVSVVFPNQQSWGTHVNIAGGAMAKNAKNPAAAVKFLEYLASPSAQNYFANGNNEWPVAKGVKTNNAALTAMSGGGDFKTETIPLAAVGANQVKIQQMLDRVGFK
ncbi:MULTISPECIES: extracellular solute-binding protein [Ramlibacter]|uniref:Extracellular solute-binding protein n=1 Tax=Ramlibacter pinisoli TaxID=2682844 RepID=A0A6N8IR86_9BURK|nr:MULTISPECIES: extracellular solute-binding protein [Ramlibacter]MBA2963406.1 extracellular solute-binding protein [Ramlibacter sp. CGMCC 1.13660]MVQ28373.1 extracellular solute-binding protein [Ramlibacter pinisoli]